jgi:hypothetical protein
MSHRPRSPQTARVAACFLGLSVQILAGCNETPSQGDGGDCQLASYDGGTCPPALVCAEPNDDHRHLDIGTPIEYPSNPPAGGAHWPVWAVWGVHATPVPVEYLVHNEEHGGVILFYNLANCDGGCPNLVADLTSFIDAQPQDPVCTRDAPADPDAGVAGVTTRMVLSADPDLDVPWAAAAWGWAYKASTSCVDAVALQSFKDAHYAQGSEDICYQGLFN